MIAVVLQRQVHHWSQHPKLIPKTSWQTSAWLLPNGEDRGIRYFRLLD
jgi:hypothetical protein